jgi:hypothetical protein
MIRLLALAAVLLSSPAGHATPAAGDVMISAQWEAAQLSWSRGDTDSVVERLTVAMRDDIYAQLSPERAYEVSEIYAVSADRQGRWAEAHQGFARAVRLPQASPEDWHGLLHDAILDGDVADAWGAFQHLTAAGSRPLAAFDGHQIDRFDRLLGTLPNATQARLALGRELEQERWTPPYVNFDPSFVWLHYVQALLEDGQAAKATRMAEHITDPVAIMAMRADRRFDGIVAANPALADPRRAAERYLATARAYAANHPRVLGARLNVARALVIQDRPAEALALLDETAPALARRPAEGGEPFDDMGNAPIVQAWRGSLMFRVGRADEGLGLRSNITDCGCAPFQIIQLADSLLEAGRTRDAARWVSNASERHMTLEERMGLARARVCVAAELGDAPAEDASLAFLRQHTAWAPREPLAALVCADRLDEARRELLRRLAEPGERLAALALLQTYASGGPAGAYATRIDARWRALARDADVSAAASKVGRLGAYDLRVVGTFGDPA